MKRIAIVATCIVLLAASLPAPTAQPNALAQLHAFANGLHSLAGNFQQILVNADGSGGKTSSGTVALEAPREFRWQTTAPYQQLIVADGARVWTYEPDLDQVTVRSQDTEQAHSPLTVLTDIQRLDQDFTTIELGSRDGLAWLRLVPRDKAVHFAWVELGFDAGTLRAMRFKDQIGNLTLIRFSDWKRNTTLPDATFTFTPPKDADVIGDTASVPEIHPLQH